MFVGKEEGQNIPFVTPILRRLEVPRLLLGAHRAPDLLAGAVAVHVVELCTDDDNYVIGDEDDEAEVAFAVEGLVFVAVDLCSN